MNKKLSANLNQKPIGANELNSNEIFIGHDTNNKPIFINIEQNPHMLVTGIVRTGKSILLKRIISDLISKESTEIYLAQLYKKDLYIFNECKQVKYNAETLEGCNQLLEYIITKLEDRYELIKDLIKEGFGDNIADYNRLNPNNKLTDIFIVIDEYASLLENIGDAKIDRELKKSITRKLNRILQIGRVLGCYLILSSTIIRDLFNNKFALAQISNKLIFTIDDSIHSRMLLETSEAKDLKSRECILLTYGKKVKIKVDEINTKDIVDKIKEYKELDHKFIELPTIKTNIEANIEANIPPINMYIKTTKE